MVRPFKVVVVGKTENEKIWELEALVFAKDQTQAEELSLTTAKKRGLQTPKVVYMKEYRRARVYAIGKFGWPDDWVWDLIEEGLGQAPAGLVSLEDIEV
uniref:Tn2-5p n=1 Tax=Thermococcus nautili TaxID=195522 RepID=D6MXZ9_9EURY|nr:hypothetical protein [Thermococcus nautili]ADF80200.1 tn2-5p [Thermococcus nautili]